ncbi:MAG: carboxypeptidase-like regulatory domain-containing protein, partial [Flavisolibacter sp.]|nr:carboxypeptidase-like regulatory domain-containing protein [Flavisolibacter sp.]
AYIKATQMDSSNRKTKKPIDTSQKINPSDAELYQMAMAEVILKLDHKSTGQIKEERTGVKKNGNVQSLFFLSNTEGDFNFYNNLVKTPGISTIPFVSPISYSGLMAYRFKLLKTEVLNGKKVYTINVKPRQVSNATVEGEVRIMDSLWVILSTKFRFPSYHLPEYDFFEVQQQYQFIDSTAWMITRQEFTYYSKTNRSKLSGQTIVTYKNFQLNKQFTKNYFGVEVSSTTQEAYEKDSSFWNTARTEPLTPKELRFIQFRDSIYRATHTKAYLDSVDKSINRITWKNILLRGQRFHNHEKEKNWYLPAAPSIYNPFQFGGSRINLSVFHSKTYKSRKNISVYADLSYGIRNKDVNGSVRFSRMYNPFNRGYYTIDVGRRFDHIFEGDAWINMLKRNNVYLANSLKVDHGLEIINGLKLSTIAEIGIRRSVSNYKTNNNVDSLFGDVLDNNQAVAFEGYNAFYGEVTLSYTPFQRYIREPKEKIILGSAWPTAYVKLRKGLPGIFNSKVDFDYLEFGLQQEIKLGLTGTSRYKIKTGSFLSRNDLRTVDYKWQRRGDPILFMNPEKQFQSLDSSFAVFKRFYQAHYVHDFNGFLLNKIPLLKKLQLHEMAGGGFLVAKERQLRYVEAFAGVERVFKWPFDPLSKFKLGVYVVGSAANQFSNPVRFKVGITKWDKRENKWF